jgi:hypothetical protein
METTTHEDILVVNAHCLFHLLLRELYSLKVLIEYWGWVLSRRNRMG